MSVGSMLRQRDTNEETPDRGGLGAGARALNYGASAVLTGVIMVGASLLLWIGVPAGWLWVGSQVQGSTNNLGAAIAVMLVGAGESAPRTHRAGTLADFSRPHLCAMRPIWSSSAMRESPVTRSSRRAARAQRERGLDIPS